MVVRPEVGSVELAEKNINRIEAKIPKFLDNVAQDTRNLTTFPRMFDAFVKAEAVGRSKKQILEILDFGVQLGAAHFVSSLGLDTDFEISFRGSSYPFVKERSQPRGMLFPNIINGALILRDKTVLQVLAQIDPNDFAETGHPMRTRFQQRLAKPEWDQEDLYLLGDLIATESDSQPRSKETREFYDNISLPCWRVCETILLDDQNAYNEKFCEAISIHKKYWLGKGIHDWDGWLSTYLLSAASVAFDRRGWQVPVETPYVPEWIVTGEALPIK